MKKQSLSIQKSWFSAGIGLSLALFLTLILSACSQPTPTVPPLPTPDTPSILEINTAIERWESGNNQRYFVEAEEEDDLGKRLIRVVVDGGEVRAAQRLDYLTGKYGPPIALDQSIAQNYTVDALLQRIRLDAIGEGPAPMDMLAIFDPLSGFPSVVETNALPSYNDSGKLVLNREYSYTLGVKVGVLIEDETGLTKELLFKLSRSGGPEAWCDTLRIFTDGTSIYSDDCRQILLQLRPPVEKRNELEDLAAEFGPVEQVQTTETFIQEFTLVGSGVGEPDSETLDTIWSLADELHSLLSKPIGAGITLLYTEGLELIGLDMRTFLTQPASLDISDPLYGVRVSPETGLIIYGDGSGLRWFDSKSGEEGLQLPKPSGGYYEPLSFTIGDTILVALSVDGSAPQLGWSTRADREFTTLPDPPGAEKFCDLSSTAGSPNQRQFLIGGSADNACTGPAGLWLVDLDGNTVNPVVSDLGGSAGEENLIRSAVDPAWSGDGTWIAVGLQGFAQDGDPPTRLYLVKPDGSELTLISENQSGHARNPTWSANGSKIFYSLDGGADHPAGIYQYDLGSSENQLLIAGDDLAPLSVSPAGEFLAFTSGVGDQASIRVWIFGFEQNAPVDTPQAAGKILFAGWLNARPTP